MELPYTVLENEFVRLEPLAEPHREGLRAACNADERLWTDLYVYSMYGEHFDPGFDRLIGFQAAGTWAPYAVIAGGQVVGVSCYLAIDLANDAVEIGGTYYRPEARGGVVNPAAKLLLMDHLFAQGCERCQYRVDAINARSRAAVTKLGAALEGIIRNDRYTWNGRHRSTAVFSILKDEWPASRARLQTRLEAFRRAAA